VAFHLLLGRVYDDKDVQERIVRNSKLDWVIVRPVILTDGLKTNAYRALVDPRDWTCGFISRADGRRPWLARRRSNRRSPEIAQTIGRGHERGLIADYSIQSRRISVVRPIFGPSQQELSRYLKYMARARIPSSPRRNYRPRSAPPQGQGEGSHHRVPMCVG
jgi:hypothetical protein